VSIRSVTAHGDADPAVSRSIIVRGLPRDRGVLVAVAILVLIPLLAILARPVIGLPDPTVPDLVGRLQPPLSRNETGLHLLGTDQLGRDIASRMASGVLNTVFIALVAVVLAAVIGSLLGILAGLRGGLIDAAIMWLVEVQVSFPAILMAMIVVTVLHPGRWTLILAIGFNSWMLFARIARARTLSLLSMPYIEAAITNGNNTRQLLAHHVLPNAAPTLLTIAVIEMARMALAEAGLSFLGFGIQPPDISLGLMLADGRGYVTTAWWIAFFPGVAIVVLVFVLNFMARRFRRMQ
jgi:peptide/nickel transport system permease protein